MSLNSLLLMCSSFMLLEVSQGHTCESTVGSHIVWLQTRARGTGLVLFEEITARVQKGAIVVLTTQKSSTASDALTVGITRAEMFNETKKGPI